MSAYDSVIINDALIGQELFIVGPSDEGDSDEIVAFPTKKGMKRYLASLNAMAEKDELIVLHGILTSAKSIPEQIENNNAYVIYLDDSDVGSIAMVPTANADDVQEAVEQIIELEMLETVDSIYILYGYEIEMCLTIHDDDIDEQVIEECKHVAKKANEISKAMEAEDG